MSILAGGHGCLAILVEEQQVAFMRRASAGKSGILGARLAAAIRLQDRFRILFVQVIPSSDVATPMLVVSVLFWPPYSIR